MSAFSLQRILPVLLASALGCGSVCAEEGTDKLSKAEIEKLDELRLDYDLARGDLGVKQWVEPMEKLRKDFKTRLGRIQKGFEEIGNLQGALAARTAAKVDPTATTINRKVAQIASVQTIFVEQKKKIELRLQQSLEDLAKSHVAALTAYKVTLTKTSRLDSAQVIDQLIKEFKAKGHSGAVNRPNPPNAAKLRTRVAFRIVKGSFTWHEAKVDAEKRGGRLAVLNTQEKIKIANAYLDQFSKWPGLWIGLKRNAGKMNWLNGDPVSASFWRVGEPNGDGDGVHIAEPNNSNGLLPKSWGDIKLTDSHAYLLELGSSRVRPRGGINQAKTLNKGLVAYYPFNGNAKDESGNNHHGVVKGAALATDRKGDADKAYFFDGTNDRIEVKDSPELNFQEEMSVSFWLKPDGSWGQLKNESVGIISKMKGNNVGYAIHHDHQDRKAIQFRSVGSGGGKTNWRSTKTDAVKFKWDHWVVTYKKGIVVWYRGGFIDQIYKELYRVNLRSRSSLFFGYTENWSPWGLRAHFGGWIDDIRIYNRALGEAEVQALYTLEKP